MCADNPIIRENLNAGATNWLLFNYHQVISPGRDELWKREKRVEGYCSHTSFKVGERLKVFVSTEPAAHFKIDFYRMGYYGGKAGRLMWSTGMLPNQPGLMILATAPTRPRDNRELNTSTPHTSTIYEMLKGNIVFDAGTCWLNMVLSTPPGSMNPPRRDFSKDDPRVQRITANLLKRMIEGKKAN